MTNLIVEIRQVNETEGYCCYDDVHESAYDNPGSLFKDCLKEYGKCGGKVYVDKKDVDGTQKPVAIGWWFEKLEKYSDSKKKFKCVTWISVLKYIPIIQPPIKEFVEI